MCGCATNIESPSSFCTSARGSQWSPIMYLTALMLKHLYLSFKGRFEIYIVALKRSLVNPMNEHSEDGFQ